MGERSITVTLDDVPFLEGRVTLGDDGACRIGVKDEKLEFWQFRRRALEQLFFGF